VHRARSLQAPAFERERWVLRDRNIYLQTCERKRERKNVSGKEKETGRKRSKGMKKKKIEGKREW